VAVVVAGLPIALGVDVTVRTLHPDVDGGLAFLVMPRVEAAWILARFDQEQGIIQIATHGLPK
jgi:hypothetical protein